MTKVLTMAAAIAGLCAMSGAASAQAVGIATSNPGSLFHNIGTAVANAANAAGLNATIAPATSPNQFIPLMNAGGIEFGIANLQEVNYALTGESWWSGQPHENLRIVAFLQPLIEGVFVRADSGITTLEQLRGQPMTDGYTAQNTILPQLDAFYSTAGMTRADMVPVNVASVTAGADAFVAGDTVGFIFAHGAGKVREADAAVGGLRALGVADTSDAALEAARAHWPTAYFTTLTAGAAPGVLEDTVYIAFPQVVFAHAGVPDDAVYALTRAMYERADVMVQTFPPMAAFDPAGMRGDPGVSAFHPGALRFYEEAGLN